MPALRARCWFAKLNWYPALKAMYADCGLRLDPPDDLVFHRSGDMWLRSTGTEATIGLMDVLEDEQVISVELPPVNSRCRVGETLATVKTSRRELMLSPHVDVTIQSRNDVVGLIPDIVRVDPYGQGWLVSVRHASSRTKQPISAGLLTWAQLQGQS
jgi:glycine cleavage system H protein